MSSNIPRYRVYVFNNDALRHLTRIYHARKLPEDAYEPVKGIPVWYADRPKELLRICLISSAHTFGTYRLTPTEA